MLLDHMDKKAAQAGRELARLSSTLGTMSIVLCLAAPCASCMPLFFSVPLSLVAIQYARGALEDTDDQVTLALGRNGMTLGLIALVYSLILLASILFYILIYVVMIAFIIAVGP